MEILIYFGLMVVLLLVWGAYTVQVKLRKETRDRELAHAERMKALELGQPLPDAGALQAEAEMVRTRATAAVGVLVPLCMAASATGGTVLVFHWAEKAIHLPILCVVWGVNGLVSMVAVTYSLTILWRPRGPSADGQKERSTGKTSFLGGQAIAHSSIGIKEKAPKT